MRALALFYVLFMASPALALDGQQRLVGVWKLESWYSEFKTTGEKKNFYGERPNGYLTFTPEKRMLVLVTAAQRQNPQTDEHRVAAFRSMAAYSGVYRVKGDRWITNVDVAWDESWIGTEQVRFFRIEGDRLTVTTAFQRNPNLPGNPETRGVLIWKRVKASR